MSEEHGEEAAGKPSAPATTFATNLREVISGALGIMIIVGTLVLLWPSLSKRPINIQDAQGIFSILGGWGGVILGYYFGRLPAERAADKAEAVAATAENEKDKAEKKVEASLAKVEAIEMRLNSIIEALEKEVG